MKVSDYIAEFLIKIGTDKVFVFTGGAIAHVIDSVGKYPNDIQYVCVQNEQAGAIAAEAYTRTTRRMGVAMTTSGPGATNLITGIVGAWFDCIPAMYFTGQVRTWELTGDDQLLQRGFQEVNISKIVESVTKYSTIITNKDDIRFELEKAHHLAISGRPGPVVIDLPMDIQDAEIDINNLRIFNPKSDDPQSEEKSSIDEIKKAIIASKKPLIIAGGGIRHANSVDSFKDFVERTNIPVILSYAGKDLLPDNHPANGGIMGQFGQNGANIILQNTDLIIGLGTRFNLRQTGNNVDQFAKNAKVISVNIDNGELKDGRIQPDLPVNMELTCFFDKMIDFSYSSKMPWYSFAGEVKRNNPIIKQEFLEDEFVNPYVFVDILSDKVSENAIIIPDAGQNVIVPSQGFKIKANQQFFSSWANSPMGYSFPASIGAYLGSPEKQVICIIGDGGMQVNLQELQTVIKYNIPIKIFIVNNHVYGAILEFQDAELDNRYEATDYEHGYSHPDYQKISSAYGIPFYKIQNNNELDIINKVLKESGPVICELEVDPGFRIESPEQKPDNPLNSDSPSFNPNLF
jgi:acetolactate synthase I/II/III large subunit